MFVIQVNAETLELEGERTNAAHKQRIILDECARMSNLIKSLLSLASSDAGNWKMDFRENDIDTLLIETWELFSQRAKKTGIQLDLDIPSLGIRDDHIAHSDVHIEGNTDIFDIASDLGADTVIFPLYCDRLGLTGLEGYKVITGVYRKDLCDNLIHADQIVVEASH